MRYGSTGNNQLVISIIEAYFKISETPSDKLDVLADGLVKLILQAFPNELKSSDAFNIPYKDISDVVFCSECNLLSDSMYGFRVHILGAIERSFDKDNPNKHHNTKKKYIKRFMHIYDKIIEHTLLAQVQRNFIQSVINDANTAIQEAKKMADDVQASINHIKKIADEARTTAKTAQDEANKANDTYKSMFANYVTILGIFTAIIVTIFGGLNVVSVVAKQADTPLETVVFLTALALMCVVSLLYFLANIIIKITQQGEDWLNWLFGIMIAVCVVAMIVSWCMTDNQQTPAPTQANIAIITQ